MQCNVIPPIAQLQMKNRQNSQYYKNNTIHDILYKARIIATSELKVMLTNGHSRQIPR